MTLLAEQLVILKEWRHNLIKTDRWCILINADPDAMASAMALKRIMYNRVQSVDIARINEITRPDNLAMIRYLHIPVKQWMPVKASSYNCFAMVDSQPCHNSLFDGRCYNVIIDHHPETNISSFIKEGGYYDIQPNIGSTSSLMTQYLRALRIRPTSLLATSLLYGIRTDTGGLERSGGEEDLKAYQWLAQHADRYLLGRIVRSEYLRSWLPFFSRAFRNLKDCNAGGAYTPINDINDADLLVSIADFFTKVHGLKWIAVSGVINKKVIVIFRGDGTRDIGRFADACFYDVGSGGGHRIMGRAEFPISAIPDKIKPADFVYNRLMTRKVRPKISTAKSA